ncbi:hypothetical protein Ndes2526A_g03729 [Nannochloris sp. 'desiccata']
MLFINTSLRGTGQICGTFKTCGDHRIHKQSPAKLLVSASLIPKDPVTNRKYQAKAPLKPQNNQDLSVAPAFGPKGIMLFGFDPKEEETIRTWLSEVLVVLSFKGVSSDPPSSGSVSTLEEAMIKLGRVELSRETPNLSLEYTLNEYPPLERPVILFSGLDGSDTIGLLEAWQEFTGIERPAAATAVVGVMKKRLSSLLADILRAQTPDAAKSSNVTVMTKSGAQEVSSENLKKQVEAAVVAQRQRREKQGRKEENRDETMTKLRAGKMNDDRKGGKGFQ